MLVAYLDPYFLGDPLFVPGLARDLADRGAGLVIVHGSGERGERALEALGRVPTAHEGVWDADDADGLEAVERAARDLNREIAHELNEAGVSAVRVMGADRGLLKATGRGLEVGRAGWVGDLAGQGVVVVVASFVGGDGPLREVDAASAAGALSAALEVPLVVLTTRSLEGRDVEARGLEGLAGAVPDLEAVRRGAGRASSVTAGPRATLRRVGGPSHVLSGG